MLPIDWQDGTAVGLVALAACYLAYRAAAVLFARRKAGCGAGCATCDGTADSRPAGSTRIVTADELAESLRRNQ